MKEGYLPNCISTMTYKAALWSLRSFMTVPMQPFELARSATCRFWQLHESSTAGLEFILA
jgi:hypothetical protein